MGGTWICCNRIQGTILINQLLNQALREWGNIHPHREKPSTLDYLIQSRDHILVFWFEIGSQTNRPDLVSKIPRTKELNYHIERSVKLVNSLRRVLNSPIIETIPHRVLAGSVNELSHIVMGALPGEPINIHADSIFSRRWVERHLSAFLSWLIEFQSQSMIGTQTYAARDWMDFFEQQRTNTFDEIPEDDRYQHSLMGISDKLSGARIPRSWGYGDAHPSNILTEGDQVSGVIDWIGVQEKQWVHIDWYYFLFFYALEYFKQNRNIDLATKRRLAISTIIGNNDYQLSGIFLAKTRQFLEHHFIDPDLSPELFVTFLYNLYWPEEKALLIQDTCNTYQSITGRIREL
jgi:hypothetical protein